MTKGAGEGNPGEDVDQDIDDDTVATVGALLAAAGLTVPDGEVQRLAGLYPALRRSVDRFYDVDVGDEVTAAVFWADPSIVGVEIPKNGMTR